MYMNELTKKAIDRVLANRKSLDYKYFGNIKSEEHVVSLINKNKSSSRAAGPDLDSARSLGLYK